MVYKVYERGLLQSVGYIVERFKPNLVTERWEDAIRELSLIESFDLHGFVMECDGDSQKIVADA